MVDRYIKELLIESNRVIVPDFGAFIARVTSENKEPDSLGHKTIVFNDILKFNDGLLVNYIIKVENADLTVALQKITDFTKIITDEFVNGNDFLIEGIGQLHRDKRGNITIISPEDNLIVPIVNIPEGIPIKIEKQEEKSNLDIISENQNNVITVELPPPVPVTQTEEILIPPVVEVKVVPPPIPEKQEIIFPPPIPQLKAEEISIPPLAEDEIKKDETPEVTIIKNQISEEIKKEPVKQEDLEQKADLPADRQGKKTEKILPEIKAKPVKPIKKEEKPQGVKKKSPVWIAIVVWSVSGLLFLSLVFMASVKFGFIKGVKLFSPDEWVSVNDKLHKDLEEYNKKHKDILTLPDVKKDDNNKAAFSNGEEGSTGSFDAPATDTKTSENTNNSTASSSEGSFGSSDTPTDTKTTKEQVKETKEQKPTVNKTDTKGTTQNTKSTESNNSVGTTGKYILVAGSFGNKNAAEIFIEQLKKKGFTNAEYVGIKNGSHTVCYGTYNDQKEANAEYQKLQQKAVQTWILKQ